MLGWSNIFSTITSQQRDPYGCRASPTGRALGPLRDQDSWSSYGPHLVQWSTKNYPIFSFKNNYYETLNVVDPK